jgi:hypothetical protein
VEPLVPLRILGTCWWVANRSCLRACCCSFMRWRGDKRGGIACFCGACYCYVNAIEEMECVRRTRSSLQLQSILTGSSNNSNSNNKNIENNNDNNQESKARQAPLTTKKEDMVINNLFHSLHKGSYVMYSRWIE